MSVTNALEELVRTDYNVQSLVKALPKWDLVAQEARTLRNPYVPASDDFFDELFYWDSWPIVRAMLDDGHTQLARGMVENFFDLIDRYGYVPNSPREYTSRSQPPLLSLMVEDVFNATRDKTWLNTAYQYLTQEYAGYWTKPPHVTNTGLSRFEDSSEELNHLFGPDYGAIQEGAWDITSVWGGRAHQVASVFLNGLLGVVELQQANRAHILGRRRDEQLWKNNWHSRRGRINRYLWNEVEGTYLDFDFVRDEQLPGRHLGQYAMLLGRFATPRQAQRLVDQLSLFESPNGVRTVEPAYKESGCQWDSRNVWAIMNLLTGMALRTYGYTPDAERIETACVRGFSNHHALHNGFAEHIAAENVNELDNRYKKQKVLFMTAGSLRTMLNGSVYRNTLVLK